MERKRFTMRFAGQINEMEESKPTKAVWSIAAEVRKCRPKRASRSVWVLAFSLLPAIAVGRGSPTATLTHDKKCEFFRQAAFSMVNFREQGRTLGYGMRMVALQLSLYKALPDEGIGEGPGLEAEYTLGLAPDIERMGHDIWTVRNLDGQPIPQDLVDSFAKQSCGWPAFDWN